MQNSFLLRFAIFLMCGSFKCVEEFHFFLKDLSVFPSFSRNGRFDVVVLLTSSTKFYVVRSRDRCMVTCAYSFKGV